MATDLLVTRIVNASWQSRTGCVTYYSDVDPMDLLEIGQVIFATGRLLVRGVVKNAATGVASNSGATIATPLRGNPAAIYHGYADLSKRQQGLLSSLQDYGSTITIGKRAVAMKVLAALTAHTGDEFLLLARKGEKLVMRGSQHGFHGLVDEQWATQMASQGWRWSGHTHPVLQGIDDIGTLMPSEGDKAILKAFGQFRSMITNSKGRWGVFDGN